MSSHVWPEWMPKPLQSGFSMQPEDRRIASSTVGTSFQKGFGGDVCTAEVSLRLNRLQGQWLERFERDDLVQGSRWFLFPVWYAGGVHWEMCRFKTRPKISTVNGFHSTISFTLYVQKRSELFPECLVKVFLCFSPCFFVHLLDAMNDLMVGIDEWLEVVLTRIEEIFMPLFAVLGGVSTASAEDALSEITEA